MFSFSVKPPGHDLGERLTLPLTLRWLHILVPATNPPVDWGGGTEEGIESFCRLDWGTWEEEGDEVNKKLMFFY